MTSSGHRTLLPITFDRKEIETWERCQSVRLFKTHHLICNMTYLGHVAYQMMRLEETNTLAPFPGLYLFSIKL